MQVEQLMTREAQACRPENTLEQAAQLMWTRDCGCLPVCGSDGSTQPIGMITDRDITMCALFQRKPLREISVSEAMSRQLRVCHAEDSLADAERAMREAKIRRLPVVDAQGNLIGMISLADMAREAARELATGGEEITESQIGDVLAAICSPGAPRLAA
jgi:CBS domain-containing protein